MWDLPGPGLEPVSPELRGGFLTTAPPGISLKHFFLKCPFLQWIYPLFSKAERRPILTSPIPLTNVQQKVSRLNKNAASNPISLLILLKCSRKEINHCASVLIWEQGRLKTPCWYGKVFWQTLILSAIYFKTLRHQLCDIGYVYFNLGAVR